MLPTHLATKHSVATVVSIAMLVEMISRCATKGHEEPRGANSDAFHSRTCPELSIPFWVVGQRMPHRTGSITKRVIQIGSKVAFRRCKITKKKLLATKSAFSFHKLIDNVK